jgi:carbonic anhydrase
VQLHVAQRERLAEAVNTGNTIQVNEPAADTLTIGDLTYQLVQYHFHNPSEHTIGGRHFPLEMHMVHIAPNGRLAVIAVLVAEGTQNSAFDPLLSNLPKEKGAETTYPSTVDVGALLPAVRSSYRYEGSLTMPPCSEGVKWIVMSTPVQMSADQISAFMQVITRNNRPVQPLNGRPIVSDAIAVSRPG